MQNKCHKKLAIDYYFHIDILFYYTLKGKKKSCLVSYVFYQTNFKKDI